MLVTGYFQNEELFQTKVDGHLFEEGQRVVLFGMEDNPEFNGEIIEITTFRESSERGRAYYFKSDNKELMNTLNWIYECRLRPLDD